MAEEERNAVGKKDGRKEGTQQGREEGRQAGRQEGREEGRKEGRKDGSCALLAFTVILLPFGFVVCGIFGFCSLLRFYWLFGLRWLQLVLLLLLLLLVVVVVVGV